MFVVKSSVYVLSYVKDTKINIWDVLSISKDVIKAHSFHAELNKYFRWTQPQEAYFSCPIFVFRQSPVEYISSASGFNPPYPVQMSKATRVRQKIESSLLMLAEFRVGRTTLRDNEDVNI